MKKLLCLYLFCFMTVKLFAQNVIPYPASVEKTGEKQFTLTENTLISYPEGNSELKKCARFLAEYISEFTGLTLRIAPSTGRLHKAEIALRENSKLEKLNREAYTIEIKERNIKIEGASGEAVFRGVQTVRKMLAESQYQSSAWQLPASRITDYPEYPYRGMHLDCARHFFPVSFVKQYIDMMVLHGMNRFHWHLTDDQGWRVEIKKYPLLTSISSIRKQTVIGRNSDVLDGTPHGGYYTQKELREIVEYAKERYVEIIPEIDMPGHMLGVLAAYPELGCRGTGYAVGQYWGIYDDILCAGNEHTYTFLEDILTELCDIFTFEYIHIGGDEAPKARWRACPKCQQAIVAHGLHSSADQPAEELLQGYFTTRMQKYLNEKGKRIIGWDELLGTGVSESATIMSWRGGTNTQDAARKNHDVIVAPNASLYFDFYQTPETWNEPLLIGGCSTVENVYNLKLVPDSLTTTERQHIIGFQANLWTEYISTPSLVEYQVLPRMAALAELQWNYSRRADYALFLQRLDGFRHLYDHYQWNYARHLWKEEFRKTAKTFG